MIYLDNASTSFPKPDVVYEKMTSFLKTAGANPGRAGHRMAVAAERAINEVRNRIVKFIGGRDPERIIFTLNATDALNIAIKGALKSGDHVITSHLEHNSISRPLKRLEENGLISITRVAFDGDGFIDPEDIERAITPRTRLIALTHASNVIGTVQPIGEVGRIARERDLLFLVDAAQTAGAIPINVSEDFIDLLAAPGHKSLLGPPGTGFLYVGERADLRPFREGGTGGDSASRLQPEQLPFRLEGGTPNTAGIAALGEAIGFIERQGIEKIRNHEIELIARLIDGLSENPCVTVFGSRDLTRHASPVSFNVEGISPEEVGAILDESFDIATRTGLHCAPYTHEMLGTSPAGTVRVSPGPFNTQEDVDLLISAVNEIMG